MDVTERRAGRHRGVGLLPARLGEEIVEVERERRHLDRVARERPLLPRAVAIQLDPIALGIRQVERLRDEVVGGAAQAPARAGDTSQSAGEVGARRDEEREVKEARGAGRTRRRVRIVHELDERCAVRAERRDAVDGRERFQADRRLVERAEALEVAGAQADGAEPRFRRQLTHRPTARARARRS
jgi:hypothetical protein